MIGIRISRSTPSEASEKPPQSSRIGTSFFDDHAIVKRDSERGASQRTLDEVRDQVAQEIAVTTATKAKYMDGVRVGVRLVMSKSEDEFFLDQIASNLSRRLALNEHLFAIGTIAQTATPTVTSLIIISSNSDLVQRAVLLASSKFLGRILAARMVDDRWIATIQDLGVSPFDETALWDVLAKASRTPMNPLMAPPGSVSIDEMLANARAKLQRITPAQAYDELRESQVGAPTFLVDIRPQSQREREGTIHGSLIIERNVLEWRFDPRSDARLAIADRYDLRIIVFCEEGYTSSLAAYSLLQLGLLNATDIIGGFEAWRDAGLPVAFEPPTSTRGSPEARSPSLVSLTGSVIRSQNLTHSQGLV